MKHFLHKLKDFVLLGGVAVFSAILLAFFVIGITFLIEHLSAALGPATPGAGSIHFSLEEAARLDYKGLR